MPGRGVFGVMYQSPRALAPYKCGNVPLPKSGLGAAGVSEAGERGEMGEKGNLLEAGEEIFANLVEQGPQFWLDYEQYKLTRAKSAQAEVVLEQQLTRHDAAAERPAHPGTG